MPTSAALYERATPPRPKARQARTEAPEFQRVRPGLGRHANAATLIRLQRTAGNAAVVADPSGTALPPVLRSLRYSGAAARSMPAAPAQPRKPRPRSLASASQDMDGDIDAYAMWAALNEGTPDVALRLDMTVSDALLDYYRTTKTNAGKGRASRYEVFVNFHGGEAKGGVIGKPAELHAQLLPPVQEFALLFFGNELKKVLGGSYSGGCFGTPTPPAPGRTVDLGKLLGDVAVASDKMTAFFVEWLKKRV